MSWLEWIIYGAMTAFGIVFAGLVALNMWISYLRWRGRYDEANRICVKCEPYVRYFFLG